MLHSLYVQAATLALALCCGLAIWKGGPAERAGALLILVTWAFTLIVSVSADGYHPPVALYLISDAILAMGLLVLAIRYSNLWMGAAMLLQALGLSFHAAYFGTDSSELGVAAKRLYILGMNLASVTMLLVLLVATIIAMIKRGRAKAAALAPVAPAAAA